MMNEQLITLVAELEYTDRGVFSWLDPIVDFETDEQKLACLEQCITRLKSQQSEDE
ncbi:hypothetical protein ACNO5E_23745 [Vibrio parahaemolyticus]|uniref:hypothetical protein n=1 Tax=Vibrio parahaemolyticus TaxID=670 RepID=UPI0013015170|nr:hypothetical protein [Vibrio parahaemolyticus]